MSYDTTCPLVTALHQQNRFSKQSMKWYFEQNLVSKTTYFYYRSTSVNMKIIIDSRSAGRHCGSSGGLRVGGSEARLKKGAL